MEKMNVYVRAIWDEDAGVFYSESDIIGLHIEAATLDEFEDAISELGPKLVMENNVSKKDMSQRSLMDLIPSIFFRGAQRGAVTA